MKLELARNSIVARTLRRFRARGSRQVLLGAWFAIASSTVPLFAQFEGALPPPSSLALGFESITQAQAGEWVNLLAGPKFEGRGTGQVGYIKAAHWVAGKAAEFGLEPMGDGGTYFQMLPMERLVLDSVHSQYILANGTNVSLADKIGLFSFSSRPEVKGKVTFLRGDANPSSIEDSAIRDRIVIYEAPAEQASTFSLTLAKLRPAALLRVIDSPAISTPQLKKSATNANLANGTMTRDLAIQTLQSVGVAGDWLSHPLTNTTTTGGVLKENLLLLDQELAMNLRFHEESISVPNVLAWLPGEDVAFNKEYVVLGAHLDHLGKQGDVYYPGADDNASGSTALLSIAKAISVNPKRPKRSILFSWFAAEEMGLVGSKYYCNQPALPIQDMCCMLNLDMVGRNEENDKETSEDNYKVLHLVGSQKGDPKLHELILTANNSVGFDFEYDEERVFLRSDQASFFKSGVSVAFLFGGFHPDYHAITDTPDKINLLKLASAAKLFYLSAYSAAEHGKFPAPQEQESADGTAKLRTEGQTNGNGAGN